MAVKLENRWIWITGASTGLGKEMVRQLLVQNNRLILTARSEENLREVQKLSPDQIWVVPADLSLQESTEVLRKEISEITACLDTVILNAGDCQYIDIENFDIRVVEHICQVNYLGFARCVDAALPLLLASSSNPHLVGISSASVFYGLPRAAAYGASKAALAHFLQSLRVDLFSKGVDVSVVYPGFVDTPLTRQNDFPMPWILKDEAAVKKIIQGLVNRKHEIAFPKPLIWSLKLLAALPSRMAVRLAQNMVRL